MAVTLVQLGPHLFQSVLPNLDRLPIDQINRETQATWATQQRLSREPAMQFTGPGQDSLILEARIMPHMFGGLETLNGLNASMRAGDVLEFIRFSTPNPGKMVPYSGHNLGSFVITSMRINEGRFASDAMATEIEFSIELTRYGDDQYTVNTHFVTRQAEEEAHSGAQNRRIFEVEDNDSQYSLPYAYSGGE